MVRKAGRIIYPITGALCITIKEKFKLHTCAI